MDIESRNARRWLARWEVLKETDHDHLEVNHRVNARRSDAALIISRSAQRADLFRKAEAFQGFLQPGVETGLGRTDYSTVRRE